VQEPERPTRRMSGQPWRRRLAIVGVAVAAILAGGVFALLMSGRGEVQPLAGEQTAMPIQRDHGSSAPSPAPSAKPLATPAVTRRPSATPSPSAAPASQNTPVPTAAEAQQPYENGLGAAGGEGYEITGTWELLPPMPNHDDFFIVDAVLLADGRIAVVRVGVGLDSAAEPRVITHVPGADTWQPIDIDRSYSPLALGADGRLYHPAAVIDPRGDRWTVEPFRLVRESDVTTVEIVSGPDGRIYRSDMSVDRGEQLIIYDPITGEFSRSSLLSRPIGYLTSATTQLYLIGIGGVATYDPAADAWLVESEPAAPGSLGYSHDTAAIGPDGRLYIHIRETGAIFAWDRSERSWLRVAPPPGVGDWSPRFVAGPDDRLYAIDAGGSFAFTPHP
jgi:hypothetical protein